MAKFFEEEINGEAQKNPEITKLYSSFQHHLGHFLVVNRLGVEAGDDTYHDVENLQKGNEFIDRLLATSKNKTLVSILREIKEALVGIDINSTPDEALLTRIDGFLDMANIERKY